MQNIQAALNKLKNDRINNISIINFIKQNEILNIDIKGDSVLARGESDRRWVYISCPNADELSDMTELLKPDDDGFAAIDDWMVPVLTKGRKISWDISVIKFYLPEDVHISPPVHKTIPLTADDAETVYKISDYKKYISLEYTIQRIQKGVSAGIFLDNKLVSWGITQDDGAIGFLHTLEQYRKKGYAYSITLSMIEELRSKDELPFAYAEASNTRSINLLTKLGFRKSNTIHWFVVE